jgi:hypothetical protein
MVSAQKSSEKEKSNIEVELWILDAAEKHLRINDFDISLSQYKQLRNRAIMDDKSKYAYYLDVKRDPYFHSHDRPDFRVGLDRRTGASLLKIMSQFGSRTETLKKQFEARIKSEKMRSEARISEALGGLKRD